MPTPTSAPTNQDALYSRPEELDGVHVPATVAAVAAPPDGMPKTGTMS